MKQPKPKTIKQLCKEAHATAIKKGWHDDYRSILEELALVHSEVSEATEEARKTSDIPCIYIKDILSDAAILVDNVKLTGKEKIEGIPAELADVCIRIFDMCGKYRIDLDRAIELKMAYNKTRPYRHGGKRF